MFLHANDVIGVLWTIVICGIEWERLRDYGVWNFIWICVYFHSLKRNCWLISLSKSIHRASERFSQLISCRIAKSWKWMWRVWTQLRYRKKVVKKVCGSEGVKQMIDHSINENPTRIHWIFFHSIQWKCISKYLFNLIISSYTYVINAFGSNDVGKMYLLHHIIATKMCANKCHLCCRLSFFFISW